MRVGVECRGVLLRLGGGPGARESWGATRACLAAITVIQGPRNAQAQDQERCEEALQPHRDRQDQDERGAQAPPADQQAEADEAARPRHDDLAAGRRQAGADLHAVSAGLRCRAMARVKRGVTTHARHKKVLGLAKGYSGRASTPTPIAIAKTERGHKYATPH